MEKQNVEAYPGYQHQVQYYETDQMGCVHHSNYIRWFEEARSDYLEYLGMGYDKMEEAGVISPVLTVEAEYKSMTRYRKIVQIRIRIAEYNGVRIKMQYEVTDAKEGTLRCRGISSHCFLNQEGRPLSLKKTQPEWDKKIREEIKE